MRTRVYVDGFNLYYGALKGTPFKWLDPVRLSALVLPSECVVDKVLHFTACVSGSTDREAPARQQVYLNALGTLPEVEVRFGSFLAKTVWRPLVNLPVADRRIDTPEPVVLPAGDHTVAGPSTQTLPVGSYPSTGAQEKRRRKATAPLPNSLIAEFHTLEEKGSDVNLAAHLLNDAWGDQFEVAAVISNDTDLVTPIRMVTRERSKTVYIVCPGRWRAAPKLREVASHVRHIRAAMLKKAQFPDTLPGTAVSKPAGWGAVAQADAPSAGTGTVPGAGQCGHPPNSGWRYGLWGNSGGIVSYSEANDTINSTSYGPFI